MVVRKVFSLFPVSQPAVMRRPASMDGVVAATLRELASLVELAVHGASEGGRRRRWALPALVAVGAAAMAAVYSPVELQAAMAVGGAASALYFGRGRLGEVAMAVAFVTALAAYLGLPSLYAHAGEVARVMLAAVAATMPVVAFSTAVGLAGVAEVARRISGGFGRLLLVFLAVLPKLVRVQLDLLLARSARNVGRVGRGEVWGFLVSALGDGVVLSTSLAGQVAMAIEARTL